MQVKERLPAGRRPAEENCKPGPGNQLSVDFHHFPSYLGCLAARIYLFVTTLQWTSSAVYAWSCWHLISSSTLSGYCYCYNLHLRLLLLVSLFYSLLYLLLVLLLIFTKIEQPLLYYQLRC